uniref:Uncharacterized protein n=1 Tax=Tetranychus urticae TaxID=32264 RepID=T1K629_TETUR
MSVGWLTDLKASQSIDVLVCVLNGDSVLGN